MGEAVRQEAHVSFPHNNTVLTSHLFPTGLHQVDGRPILKAGGRAETWKRSPFPKHVGLSLNERQWPNIGWGQGKRDEKTSLRHHRLTSSAQEQSTEEGESWTWKQDKRNYFAWEKFLEQWMETFFKFLVTITQVYTIVYTKSIKLNP